MISTKNNGILFKRIGSKAGKLSFVLPLIPHVKESIYVELFAGTACVLANRRPSKVEIYNDLDEIVVNLFRVMRNLSSRQRLEEKLFLTPYSEIEHRVAYQMLEQQSYKDDVEKAWAFFVASNQSFCGSLGSWGKQYSLSQNITRTWKHKIDYIEEIASRMANVQLFCSDWEKILNRVDSPDTIIYCDPPYWGTQKDMYNVSFSTKDHERLLNKLITCQSAITLSGYNSMLYDKTLLGWKLFEKDVYCNIGRNQIGRKCDDENFSRTECVWLNSRAVDLLKLNNFFF